MISNPFPFRIERNSFLGVDIGTSSVKVVELSRQGSRKKLENYGEIQAQFLYEKPFRTFEKSTLVLSNHDVVRAILAVLGEAKIKTKKAYFSIPDFATFFTTFDLPAMNEEELPQAVQYEARQHVPLSLSEITLDWQIIEKRKDPQSQDKSSFRILLVAVPNEIISQYQDIAKAADLTLLALEAEVFSLARALAPEQEKSAFALVDFGARSTTISIVDNGVLKTSHSFDSSGNNLTESIARGLNIGYEEAEELKRKYGLLPSSEKSNIWELVLPLLDLILEEIKKILQNFFRTETKEISKIILAGGSAWLPGISDYFSKNLDVKIEIADSFGNIYYPPILEEILKEMGPSFAIAVGTALRGLK